MKAMNPPPIRKANPPPALVANSHATGPPTSSPTPVNHQCLVRRLNAKSNRSLGVNDHTQMPSGLDACWIIAAGLDAGAGLRVTIGLTALQTGALLLR